MPRAPIGAFQIGTHGPVSQASFFIEILVRFKRQIGVHIKTLSQVRVYMKARENRP